MTCTRSSIAADYRARLGRTSPQNDRRMAATEATVVGREEVLQAAAGLQWPAPPHADALGALARARDVRLKAELFQRTGSFKPRGVLTKLAALTPRSGSAA